MHRLLLPILLMFAIAAFPSHASAASASGEEVDGGAAATQATAIESDTTYVDDVSAGEARWFSFDAGTSQVIGVTLTEYGEVEYGCCLEVKLHNPDFDRIVSDNLSNSDGTAKTVRISSDEDGLDDAGSYYLEVTLDSGAANRPVAVEFAVDVTGEAVESASPSEQPSSPDETAAEDDEPAADEDSEAAAVGSDDGGGSGLLWVVIGLLALLVVLLLGALVFLFIRLQKQQPSSSA